MFISLPSAFEGRVKTADSNNNGHAKMKIADRPTDAMKNLFKSQTFLCPEIRDSAISAALIISFWA